MPSGRRWGDRVHDAVPPLVLVVGGLLVALVAGVLLVSTLLRDGQTPVASTTPPVTSAATVPSEDAQATSTTDTGEGRTASAGEPATAPPGAPVPSPGIHGWSASGDPGADARPTATGSSSAASTAARAVSADRPVGEPAWIRIASAGVDGSIVPQGLAADGTINPGRNEIIWFTGNGRVSPGQVGTSVIAAHVTWEGAPDAFAQLPSVGPGDVVEVGYADGSTRSFTVRSTAAVDKDALARSLAVWGGHPDVPRLAIITCDPVMGYQADGHTQANFVVIAEG
ncbi:class F sortase [uncultured Ornithinimicrobium sp.]|uniref:class F sortase n=1 Tax=uncultured Ornithinimicrobium sp. TaxID=259307 RepID=UPI0025919B77|nr:class F sortase [uncultured Ornithinimicrobium sp.]